MGWRADSSGDLRTARLCVLALCCTALASCSSSDKFARKVDPRYGVSASPRVVDFGDPVPKGGGTYRTGRPYVVAGRTYVPHDGPGYRAEGLASWYGDDFHGRRTANGEVFDMHSISAAHPTLPMPSYARVTNLSNGRSIIVRVNDRGPFHSNRVIDLSVKSAQILGFHGHGLARVRVEYVGSAPLEGSDDRMLMATLRHNGPAPAPSRVMVASAKPFVPQLDERTGPPLRGAVPVPGERPFTLGTSEPAAGSTPARLAVAAVPLPELSAAARIEQAAPKMMWQKGPDGIIAHSRSPVAAYAPAPPIHSTGFLSGRGLY